ncbi:MAG TPA: vWA domain-containing protein [Phycisphaerae bacterium]|nr:vWA domain-containing protein [Phycisphaerae bacterium]
MDLVRLASPWLLAVALPAWAIILYATVSRGRREGAAPRAALACLAATLLVLALAGPSIRTSRQGLCPIVIVHDSSPSMSVGPAAPVTQALLPWTAALAPGRVDLRPFAAGDETDIERGLSDAAAALPDGQGVLLLYSDARETRGDAVRAAARLAAAGVRVHAVAPDLRPRDAGIVWLGPASTPMAGRPVQVEIRVASTLQADAAVFLSRAAAPDAPPREWTRQVSLDPAAGATVLVSDDALPPGIYHYEARVRMEGDQCPRDDRARCAVRVGAYQEVLYVHAGAEAGALARLLPNHLPAGVHMKAALAAARPALGGVSAVVLDNVSAWSLGHDAARRLALHVTDGGLGLLVLGGDAAFAAGGYGDSPLDHLLPVSSRTGERPPLEIVLVVDSSGSMNEEVGRIRKLALAKEAVLALRPALGQADRIGIVAFAGEPRVVSPLVPLAQWDALRSNLLAIQAGGGTRITPAVEAAAALFAPPRDGARTVRHLMLLSDGRSADFDVPRLIGLCRGKAVSASAVATGPDAQREALGRLAADTGGRLYAEGDLSHLAETFLKDLALARGEGLRPLVRTTLWSRPEPIWPAPAQPRLPSVPGYNVTRLKNGADLHWVTGPPEAEPDASPLLASWQRGLGRVAVMPWPAGDAPAAWQADGVLDDRLAQVIAWLVSAKVPTDWSARLVRHEGAWWVRVEERADAIGRSSSPFLAARLGDASDERAVVTLAEVAPGIHEGEVGDSAASAVVVRREDNAAESVSLSAPALPPEEFRRLGVDRARLEAIVRAGGGQVHADPESLVHAVRQVEVRGFTPVGAYLLWAAAAVVLAQVALRLVGRL